MWKPLERIKYLPSPGQWPTQSEARDSILFSAIHYQALRLKHRTWVPAMVPWRATDEGEVTEEVVDWYRRFARGKPGAIVVEATGIRDIPSGPLLRIGHDRYLEGLKQIVDAVRQESEGETRLFIQLIDFLGIRKRPGKEKFLQRFLKITPELRSRMNLSPDVSEKEVRSLLLQMSEPQLAEVLSANESEALNFGLRQRITDTHMAEIQNLPELLPKLFTQAAQRALAAGFDGVELHYAHAYTMASFLSATNHRADGYGGSLENRVRLPLEVYRSVRNSLPKEFVVGCRMLSEECIAAGSTVSDSAYFAEAFARAGMDFISVSRGGKFDDAKQPKPGWAIYPYTGPSGYECMPQYISDNFGPFGRNFKSVAYLRKQLRQSGLTTPMVIAGGIHNFEQAESTLQNGQADIVGFARQAMADPDWFQKVLCGEGEQVRLCKYTNYCEGLDQKHKQVTCNLWDRTELKEAKYLSKDGRRRLTAPDWNKK